MTAVPKLLPIRFSRVEGGYLISDGNGRKADPRGGRRLRPLTNLISNGRVVARDRAGRQFALG